MVVITSLAVRGMTAEFDCPGRWARVISRIILPSAYSYQSPDGAGGKRPGRSFVVSACYTALLFVPETLTQNRLRESSQNCT